MHKCNTRFGRAVFRTTFFAAGVFAPFFSRRVRYEVERALLGTERMPEEHLDYLSYVRARRRDIERRVGLLGPRCLSLGERLWLRWQMMRLEAA